MARPTSVWWIRIRIQGFHLPVAPVDSSNFGPRGRHVLENLPQTLDFFQFYFEQDVFLVKIISSGRYDNLSTNRRILSHVPLKT
ncbi:hypothetical protein WAI453_009725 [Rhynchosporium graminicola]